jgi:hypothetical protein
MVNTVNCHDEDKDVEIRDLAQAGDKIEDEQPGDKIEDEQAGDEIEDEESDGKIEGADDMEAMYVDSLMLS